MPSLTSPAVGGAPGRAAVVGAEHPGRGDRDEHPVRVARVGQDRVQAHAARAGLPVRAGAVLAQAGQLRPGAARRRPTGTAPRPRRPASTVSGSVADGSQVPHPRELPRVRRAVVPLVGAGHARVGEVAPDGLPGAAAVLGAVDLLAEPARGRRRPDPVGLRGRARDVVHLQAREERPFHRPVLPRAVRGEDERALARADEYSNSSHDLDDRRRPANSSAGEHDPAGPVHPVVHRPLLRPRRRVCAS